MKHSWENEAAVDWDEAEFTDNSGSVTIDHEPALHPPGSNFTRDEGEVSITYTGVDPAGNNKTCDFTVTLTGRTRIPLILRGVDPGGQSPPPPPPNENIGGGGKHIVLPPNNFDNLKIS